MQSQEPTDPDTPHLKERVPEKVIQPINTKLPTSAAARPVAAHPSSSFERTDTSAMLAYEDINDGTFYSNKKIATHEPAELIHIRHVAVEHKSLLVLATLGLIDTGFLLYVILRTGATVGTNAWLDVLYANVLFNLFIYTYFLFAKSRHLVLSILRALLFFQFIAVFGIFWGASVMNGAALFVNGLYLLFIYTVYMAVKTPV